MKLVGLFHFHWLTMKVWTRFLCLSVRKKGVPDVTQQKQTQVVSIRMRVQSQASHILSGIWHCHELWCRSKMWLGSCIAVAVAGSCSSNLTPSLGTSICHGSGPRNGKRAKRLKKKKLNNNKHKNKMVAGIPAMVQNVKDPLLSLQRLKLLPRFDPRPGTGG